MRSSTHPGLYFPGGPGGPVDQNLLNPFKSILMGNLSNKISPGGPGGPAKYDENKKTH